MERERPLRLARPQDLLDLALRYVPEPQPALRGPDEVGHVVGDPRNGTPPDVALEVARDEELLLRRDEVG